LHGATKLSRGSIVKPIHLALELNTSEGTVRVLLRRAFPDWPFTRWQWSESDKEAVLHRLREIWKTKGTKSTTPRLTPRFSPDTALMREVAAHFGSMEKVARAIDVSTGTIWRSTHVRISPKTAAAIERASGGKFSAAALCRQEKTPLSFWEDHP
jgi:hypothetical protein